MNDVYGVELRVILLPVGADTLKMLHLPRKIEGFGT